ncbi:MAG: hypothetical protein CVU05_05760 [Bacteroidetes bacterium HGW-Bacteroidetes-21]|jgi:serine/threonine protein kinase|nr:MAG: hypothetical protein CVU05_05760 [Bacteroidetes bacterium HGW-Bacteroidetes-21]
MIYKGGLSDYERLSPVEDKRQDNARFSKVYKAFRSSDQKPVIIKTLHPRYHAEESAIEQFMAEAELNLDFPGIVQYLEKGIDPEPFIVTEYFDGYHMGQLNRLRFWKKSRKREFIVKVFVQLCDILDHIHSRGILHCDIKPSNILIGKDIENPTVRLIDFGQAVNTQKIRFNIKNFSMIYSPPELITGKFSLLCPASDIFSTGVTMYECLTGRYPFRHCNSLMVLAMQLNVPLPKNDTIPLPLYNILLKASAKKGFPKPPNMLSAEVVRQYLQEGIQNRYQTANEMGQDLKKWLSELKK